MLIRNGASSSKVLITAKKLFCSSALVLCSTDVAKLVGKLGILCTGILVYIIAFHLKVFNIA